MTFYDNNDASTDFENLFSLYTLQVPLTLALKNV